MRISWTFSPLIRENSVPKSLNFIVMFNSHRIFSQYMKNFASKGFRALHRYCCFVKKTVILKFLRQTFYAVYGSFPIVLLWFFFETRMTFFASFFKAYTAKKFDA